MNGSSGIVRRRGSGTPIPLHILVKEPLRRGGEEEPKTEAILCGTCHEYASDGDGGFDSSSATDMSLPGVDVVFVPRLTEAGTSSNLRRSLGRRASFAGMLQRDVGSQRSFEDLLANLEDHDSSVDDKEEDQDEDLVDAVPSEGQRPSLPRPSVGEDQEKDLLTEAQRYLSACALSSLYGHLRDMSERGYASKSRFVDIDVNRSERSHYDPADQHRRRFQRRPSGCSQRSACSSLSGTVGGCEGGHSLTAFGFTEHEHDGLRAPGAPGCADYDDPLLKAGGEDSGVGATALKYLDNTRSAGSVVRRLLEELESIQRENGDVGSCCEEGRGCADNKGMSEFRRWVNESRIGGGSQGGITEGAAISQWLSRNQNNEAHRNASAISGEETSSSSRNNADGPSPLAGEWSSKDGGGEVPRRRSTSGLVPSFFESGSILASMMEQGIEIAYFSRNGLLDEVDYCLCVDRETRTVIAVFLGAVTMQSCMNVWMWERHNPIEDERYEGWSNRFRLHGRFCSPLLRQRRDTGCTKFDEISCRIDAIGHELCQDDEGSCSYQVSVAGHSLGGALATVFGFHYAANAGAYFSAAAAPIRVFTFGAPPVGDDAFRSAHQHLEQMGRLRHARFVDTGDVVPLMPAFSNGVRVGLLFRHIGLRVALHSTGTLHGIDATYPVEMSWFSELKEACSNNILNSLSSIRGLRMNHSLSEHHRRLQLARLLKEDIKTLEEYYQIWAGIFMPMGNNKESREKVRRHFSVMSLFSFSILACCLVCGFVPPFSTREAKTEVGSGGCVFPVGFQHEDAQESTSISNSSNQITHYKWETPEEFNQMNDRKNNIIDVFPSSAVPAHSQGIGIDEADQEAQIPPMQAELMFLNKEVLQSGKWGLPFPQSSREVDSGLILDIRRKAELSTLKVEWEARSFARAHIVPAAIPTQLSLESEQENDGSKCSKWP